MKISFHRKNNKTNFHYSLKGYRLIQIYVTIKILRNTKLHIWRCSCFIDESKY